MGNYISEQPWISEGMVDFTVARKRTEVTCLYVVDRT